MHPTTESLWKRLEETTDDNLTWDLLLILADATEELEDKSGEVLRWASNKKVRPRNVGMKIWGWFNLARYKDDPHDPDPHCNLPTELFNSIPENMVYRVEDCKGHPWWDFDSKRKAWKAFMVAWEVALGTPTLPTSKPNTQSEEV